MTIRISSGCGGSGGYSIPLLRGARPARKQGRVAGDRTRFWLSVRNCSYGPDVPKKYREVRAVLQEAGWRVIRQRGSHEVWAHPDHEQRVVVAGKPNATVPAGTLSSIRRVSGLEHLQ